MKKILQKLLLGEKRRTAVKNNSTISRRIQNIKVIWNNTHHDDVGIEKILRLVLAASQFLFPGLYIKHFFARKGSDIQDLSTDFYILIKVFFPLSLLFFQVSPTPLLLVIIIWLLTETLMYVPTLIFASDIFSRPSSYRRSMLMLFFNYLETVFSFGFIYTAGQYLNQPFSTWYDPIYFSITTLGTIGFGDFYPVTGIGKMLVCIQSMVFLSFVVLFINFFSNKVESRGYFDQQNRD